VKGYLVLKKSETRYFLVFFVQKWKSGHTCSNSGLFVDRLSLSLDENFDYFIIQPSIYIFSLCFSFRRFLTNRINKFYLIDACVRRTNTQEVMLVSINIRLRKIPSIFLRLCFDFSRFEQNLRKIEGIFLRCLISAIRK
jgi:hypothetical protein